MDFTILGCGSSPGVPRVNGDWGACDPAEPRNRRRRSAALVELTGPNGKTSIAIDCGPDFREQMLAAQAHNLHAVVITHAHADHIHGMDDIRGYAQITRQLVDVYADSAAYERINEAFGYCYKTPAYSNYPPIVRHVEIDAGHNFEVPGPGGSILFQPFRQIHGSIHSLGFRIGPVAYCSDVSDFPDPAIAEIKGADWLIIDALQRMTHPSHLSLAQSLEWIARFKVPNAVLTHMHTPLDYQTLCNELPPHIRPAYDGLKLSFDL
ncbi:MBL fold metallo-hydrolase [Aureimonas fodinaquatilis]|uniref:MBL fold metallo-hydrolase n=2 Tax=Aureimonas fodinaquatilis TaxID=2565783 RepID=A0A5B0DXK2_9HYPH|nr:MBL fold metallo-hydrolase [Aureimonas fodinaquatilis]KAA0971216.1 MBL fold metallo-hydrolase [Aureimonas fodinaquatilis]